MLWYGKANFLKKSRAPLQACIESGILSEFLRKNRAEAMYEISLNEGAQSLFVDTLITFYKQNLLIKKDWKCNSLNPSWLYKLHYVVWSTFNNLTYFFHRGCRNITISFHVIYCFSCYSILNKIILAYTFFFHYLPQRTIIYHLVFTSPLHYIIQ